MVRTTGPGRTTAGAQWWLLSEIGLIIEVPDIGTGTHITFGGRDTGVGGVTNKSGSAVITSYADTDQRVRSATELLHWVGQAPAHQTKTNGRRETPQSIAHTSTKIYRRRFRHIASWTRHFTNRTAKRDDLDKDLIIKNKIIRVSLQRQPLQQFSRKRSVSSVILRKFGADENILHQREESV